MKSFQPIILSVVALAVLGLAMQTASAADGDRSGAKKAPRIIKINPANLRRADAARGNCASCRSNCSGQGCSTCSDCGACSECGSCGPAHAAGCANSGQPLVDPYARGDWRAAHEAAMRSWHAGYYHTAWGQPVALMVSPQVRMQTRWSWGVAQSTMLPIYHQYERPYPGPAYGGGMAGGTGAGLLPTPRWPSHTDQFGVYYVRGPW